MRYLLALLIAIPAFGQVSLSSPGFIASLSAQAAAPGASYLVNQGFEGAGYDNGETWTESGTVDEDYTTETIIGSQTCAVTGIFANTYASYSGQTDVWAFTRLRFRTGINGGTTFRNYFYIADSSGTILASIKFANVDGIGSACNVRLETSGTESASSASTVDINTSYYVWLHFVSGGTCSAHISTSSTRPSADGGGDVYLTKSAGSATAARIYLMNVDGIPVFDHVLVDDAEIGNNP